MFFNRDEVKCVFSTMRAKPFDDISLFHNACRAIGGGRHFDVFVVSSGRASFRMALR